MHVFHTLSIANTNCGVQKLRCFAGAHVFNNENQQDTFAAIPSLAFNQPGKAKEWKCGRGAAMTMEVGRLVKLFKIFINPSDSTGQDTIQLSLAYVSWFDR